MVNEKNLNPLLLKLRKEELVLVESRRLTEKNKEAAKDVLLSLRLLLDRTTVIAKAERGGS